MSGKKSEVATVPADTIDGVDHIRIDVQGQTKLGRLLATFSRTPFKHPYFGPFISMEGFIQYVRSVEKPDALRRAGGVAAKALGKTLTQSNDGEWKSAVKDAMWFKVEQSEEIMYLMRTSELPFENYYVHGPGKIRIRPSHSDWQLETYENIRRMVKTGERPALVDFSHSKLLKHT